MSSNLEQLANWMNETRQQNAWNACLVPEEPVIFRKHSRDCRAMIERASGQILTAGELASIAEEILGRDCLASLGREVGSLDVRVKLPDGTYASITVARAGGEVTMVARPVRTMNIDCSAIRVPEPIIKAAESSSGLLVVTGPAGCGKTTTCYALLDHLNATRPIHIAIVGYELEFVLEPKQALVLERQIGVDAPDMLAGMQSAVMQGADVVFVGEIRDIEVFHACLRMAEHGCMVITQLHQPTPQAAIERVISLQPEEARPTVCKALAQVLRGVLAQYLLPTPDGKQVPAYGSFVPDADSLLSIEQGGQGLDDFCRPRIEDDIRNLAAEGRADPVAAEQALSFHTRLHH